MDKDAVLAEIVQRLWTEVQRGNYVAGFSEFVLRQAGLLESRFQGSAEVFELTAEAKQLAGE
jgi:hypothetical protein